MIQSIWLVRHGETPWSRSGQHTSRTDLDLTAEGVRESERLRTILADIKFDRVLCSPLGRSRQTAELAGLVPFETVADLKEWDYGDLEGMTTPEIQRELPDWSIWDGPWPGGETAEDVASRADRLLAELRADSAQTVALVGHGHFTRVLAARWVDESVTVGRWLYLQTATVSELGWARETPVVRQWNLRA